MADKQASVAELTGLFQTSKAVLLTEYRGLTVAQLKELRRSISADATYAVAKNTLLSIAAKNAGVTAFDGQLAGPTAMTFVSGDVVTVAKALRDFAKANTALVIKGGYCDGAAITADEVKKLAAETEAGIVSGSIKPFACPVAAQDGTAVECKGGDHLDDGQVAAMNFFVKGIDAALPGQ